MIPAGHPLDPGRLRLPVIASPLFIISGPELVIAQCTAGIIGSLPALNARPQSELGTWLERITRELSAFRSRCPGQVVAPFAVNQIVHRSNPRLEADLEICARWGVPIVITSLGAQRWVNDAVHAWGGVTLHDVINDEFARKAVDKGADGLILVCAGAGGHAGILNPWAFVREVRQWFSGPLVLAGAISHGRSILAARAAGADLAYIGSPFIATAEANAAAAHKDAIVDARAADIVYSSLFTGVHGNYLRASIASAGLDPDDLPAGDPGSMDFGSGGISKSKAWRDIWGAGQGVGAVHAVEPAADLIGRLESEYLDALAGLASSARAQTTRPALSAATRSAE